MTTPFEDQIPTEPVDGGKFIDIEEEGEDEKA
jgi:hypothetical protein